jgi:glycosyltransferase involved in cell wall biosynthesis
MGADLALTLCDPWVLTPEHLAQIRVAHWIPVDCDPLSAMDRECLNASGATPVAMSRFGQEKLFEAGFPEALYAPHGIETSLFRPPTQADRDQFRAQVGAAGKFAIGMNVANKDAFRKGMFEQAAAFKILHERHPDTILLIHGLVAEAGGVDMGPITANLGIGDAVSFVDQYPYMTGQCSVNHLVNWYGALDLYSACSLGEGFCLPAVEAQSCGVPVVVTDASALPEVCGGGWMVPAERFWNPTHRATWAKPSIDAIADVYEEAYQRGKVYQREQEKAREFALRYDVEKVEKEHWIPVLEALEANL